MNGDGKSARAIMRPTFERFRATIDGLWPHLSPADGARGCSRIVCVGAEHGDGTTTIASCAAIGLAENLHAEVLLLEANMRTPGLAAMVDLGVAPGLCHVLADTPSWRQSVVASDISGLSVLTAGVARVDGPAFDPAALPRLFAELQDKFRVVVIDAPPLLLYGDGRLLLSHADTALPIVCAGHTGKAAARAMLRELEGIGVRSVCTVLNRSPVAGLQFVDSVGHSQLVARPRAWSVSRPR